MKAAMTKQMLDQAELIEAAYDGVTRHFLTVHAFEDQGPLFSDFLPAVGGREDLHLYSQRVFGGHGYYDRVAAAQGRVGCPITWLQGDGCSGKELSGVQFCGVSGTEVRPVILEGKRVGTVYEDAYATYCFLPGVVADDLQQGRDAQTRAVFERIEDALATEGMVFTDVARTWIYLDQLLEWYDPFNVVRTQFFEERGVFDHMVPASTGIGAGNPAGAACLIDVYAIKPKSDVIQIRAVPSPLQCAALDYRSSFSRAVEVAYPGMKELYISGSASIHPGGETAHVGDVRKQVTLTMEVVEALLASRGLGWEDTVRGIAYFKSLRDVSIYEAVCKEMGIGRLPMALSHADVCRDDLLFEVELDAIRGVAE